MVALAVRAVGLGLCLTLVAGCSDGDTSAHLSDGATPDSPPGAAPQDAQVRALDAAQQTPQRGGDSGTSADSGTSQASTDDAGTAAPDATVTGPHVNLSNPRLHELALDPHVLDPSTLDSLSTEYAQLDTRAAPLGKLVVFLPGANNVPKDWRDHGRKLAEYGFHVLIPHYNNRWSSDDTCTNKGNDCADNTRWEALVGEDASSAVTISRADSAEGRVITLLRYLITADADGDWGYYLSADGGLQYGLSIIAGISHGAASAGMYAARRPFARNVMHSSGPAGSSSAAKLTPLSSWYGFAHTEDPAYSAITSAWNSVGLLGQLTSIDGQSPPFGNSHRLNSSAATSYPHGSVCVHSSSPKDAAGNYLFESTWRYLYGVPAK